MKEQRRRTEEGDREKKNENGGSVGKYKRESEWVNKEIKRRNGEGGEGKRIKNETRGRNGGKEKRLGEKKKKASGR